MSDDHPKRRGLPFSLRRLLGSPEEPQPPTTIEDSEIRGFRNGARIEGVNGFVMRGTKVIGGNTDGIGLSVKGPNKPTRPGKPLGVIVGLITTVAAGGIVHFLGWA